MPGMCIFIAGEGVFKMTDDKTMEDFDQWWASVSNEAYTSDEKHAAIAGWQAAKERYGRDEDAALDLLCVMFDGYENGIDCYEDPEDQSGYVGSAFRLSDEDFHKIADLLNRRRPVSQPATKEQKHD